MERSIKAEHLSQGQMPLRCNTRIIIKINNHAKQTNGTGVLVMDLQYYSFCPISEIVSTDSLTHSLRAAPNSWNQCNHHDHLYIPSKVDNEFLLSDESQT